MASKKASSGGPEPARKRASKKPVAGKKAPRSKKVAKKPAAKPDVSSGPRKPKSSAVQASLVPLSREGFPIVGIGASAGGLEALTGFFEAMPNDSGMAFVLVVHLDPTHVSILPELLQKHTKMAVHRVEDGMKAEPNSIYVIPPSKDLSILNGTLELLGRAQSRGLNLPIDTFFRSLAQDQGSAAICIILSGTGTDGTLGLRAVKGELGMAMVQSEDSAKYDGMPRSAIATGLADYVDSPDKMPEHLIQYVRNRVGKAAPTITPTDGNLSAALRKVFIILRAETGNDFSLYKENTISRRIERRMNVRQIGDIDDYVTYLQNSEHEAQILFKELLIGVTSFFRDPEAFEVLKKDALLKMLRGKPDDCTVRAWVPGCSSGEEAYSLAILLHECMETLNRHYNVQIFGTDIDAHAISIARAGLYPGGIVADVGAERLKRYFTKEEDGQYRIKKNIRDLLVFAPQNVIKDPPFTKLDLLSCRNLLIYLGPELQKKLLPMFCYSLRQDGILFLGSSETIGPDTDLFDVLSKKWKIFRRKAMTATPHSRLPFPTALSAADETAPVDRSAVQKAEEISALQLVETILQQSDAPPCAIIDGAGSIVYVHGRTGRYLELAQGHVSANIVEMACPELRTGLSAAIHKVARHRQETTERGLRIQHNGGHLLVDLTVKPILAPAAAPDLMMVIFEEVGAPTQTGAAKAKRPVVKKSGRSVAELEQDLQSMRGDLQITIEELETSNEELKSANEELQSTNEELQSTNEEMETSKEELQSLNEESSTVNAELQSRIDELSQINDDMKNLLDSTEIATIFLDADLCIRRFTPQATRIIPLVTTDLGRSIAHFATNLSGVDLADEAGCVLDDLAVRDLETQSKDGRAYLLRTRPYRTVANVIDGVVMTFEDMTERKAVEDEVRDLSVFPIENPNIVIRVGDDGTLLYANPASQWVLTSWKCDIGGAVPAELRTRVQTVSKTGVRERISTKIGQHNLLLAAAPVADRNYVNLYECASEDQSTLAEDEVKS